MRKTKMMIMVVVAMFLSLGLNRVKAAANTGRYPETTLEKDYICSQMSETERSVYSQMYSLCFDFLTNRRDVGEKSGYHVIGPVDYSSVGDERLGKLFLENECQEKFFFINSVMYSTTESYVNNRSEIHTDLYFIVRDDCVSGESRYEKYLNVMNTVDSIVEPIMGWSDIEKAKYIYSTVANMLTYDLDYVNMQCVDQVISNRVTVCGGYARFFAMLANAVGLQCMVVTSETHAWDMVCVDGIWYHVDITFDDIDGPEDRPCLHDRFLRSDDYIMTVEYHDMCSDLRGYYPVADQDFYTPAEYELLNAYDWGLVSSYSSTDQTPNETDDTTTDSMSGNGNINVNNNVTSTMIELSKTNLEVVVNDIMKLDAVVLPSGDSDELLWTSSNPDVITVNSNGYIRAISSGDAVITVSSEDGMIQTTCQITVVDSKGNNKGFTRTYKDYDEQLNTIKKYTEDFEIVSVDGSIYSINDFTNDMTVLILGRTSCGNCSAARRACKKAISIGKDVKTVFLAVDDRLETFSTSMVEDDDTLWSDNYSSNNRLLWDTRNSVLASGGTLMLPVIMIFNSEHDLVFFNTHDSSTYGTWRDDLEKALGIYNVEESNGSADSYSSGGSNYSATGNSSSGSSSSGGGSACGSNGESCPTESSGTNVDATLVKHAFSKKPTMTFKVGDNYVFNGTIVAVFSDGTKQEVPNSALSVIKPDMSTAGNKKVYLSYTSNGETYKLSYDIKVEADTSSSTINSKTKAPTTKIKKLKFKKANRLVLKWGRKRKALGYEVEWGLDPDFKDAQVETVFSNSLVFTGLQKGDTYYFRVRTYVYDDDFNKVKGSWSSTWSITR